MRICSKFRGDMIQTSYGLRPTKYFCLAHVFVCVKIREFLVCYFNAECFRLVAESSFGKNMTDIEDLSLDL